MIPLLAILLTLAVPAFAAPPATLEARLLEAEQLREQRLLRERWRPSAETYAAALKGELVTGIEGDEGPRRVWVVAVLDVSLPRFWAAINDDRSKVQFTRLDYLALVEGQFCGAHRKRHSVLPRRAKGDRLAAKADRVLGGVDRTQRSEGLDGKRE